MFEFHSSSSKISFLQPFFEVFNCLARLREGTDKFIGVNFIFISEVEVTGLGEGLIVPASKSSYLL
jgi:hypothetical protein